METGENKTSVCADNAFSKNSQDVRDALENPDTLDKKIREPLAHMILRRAYQALSSGIDPRRCTPSRLSNHPLSTMPKEFSTASSKYAGGDFSKQQRIATSEMEAALTLGVLP